MADVRGYVQSQFGGPVSAAQAAMQQRSLMHQGAHMRPAPGVMAGSPGADRGRVFAQIEAGIDSIFNQIDDKGGVVPRKALQDADALLSKLKDITGPEADFARSILEPLIGSSVLDSASPEAIVDSQLSAASSPASSDAGSGDEAAVPAGAPGALVSSSAPELTAARTHALTTLKQTKEYGQLALVYADSSHEVKAGIDAARASLAGKIEFNLSQTQKLLKTLGEPGAALSKSLNDSYQFAKELWHSATVRALKNESGIRAYQAQAAAHARAQLSVKNTRAITPPAAAPSTAKRSSRVSPPRSALKPSSSSRSRRPFGQKGRHVSFAPPVRPARSSVSGAPRTVARSGDTPYALGVAASLQTHAAESTARGFANDCYFHAALTNMSEPEVMELLTNRAQELVGLIDTGTFNDGQSEQAQAITKRDIKLIHGAILPYLKDTDAVPLKTVHQAVQMIIRGGTDTGAQGASDFAMRDAEELMRVVLTRLRIEPDEGLTAQAGNFVDTDGREQSADPQVAQQAQGPLALVVHGDNGVRDIATLSAISPEFGHLKSVSLYMPGHFQNAILNPNGSVAVFNFGIQVATLASVDELLAYAERNGVTSMAALYLNPVNEVPALFEAPVQ